MEVLDINMCETGAPALRGHTLGTSLPRLPSQMARDTEQTWHPFPKNDSASEKKNQFSAASSAVFGTVVA